MMLRSLNQEQLKKYNFKCLKYNPFMYILYYIFGFDDKKYFKKQEFKIEYVIDFLRRNKEYKTNGKNKFIEEINTVGIDLNESCDNNSEKNENGNKNDFEQKIEEKGKNLSEKTCLIMKF